MPDQNDSPLPASLAGPEAAQASKAQAMIDGLQATLDRLDQAALKLREYERAEILAACREAARAAFERTVVFLVDLDGPTAQAITAFLERYDDELKRRLDVHS